MTAPEAPSGWAGLASLFTVYDDDGTVLWRGAKGELRDLVLAHPPARAEVEAAGFRRWLGKGRYEPDATKWIGYVPPRFTDRDKWHIEANPSPVRQRLLAAVRLALAARDEQQATDTTTERTPAA